ncbi:MAG: DUF285 domain-containing protein, partial [archaeon]|nr:DUF285 domain-containing protein [archaeon]
MGCQEMEIPQQAPVILLNPDMDKDEDKKILKEIFDTEISGAGGYTYGELINVESKFFILPSIQPAMDKIKEIEFELAYVVVHESLFKDFSELYKSEIDHLRCLVATVVYCKTNEEYKAAFNLPNISFDFLCPGEVKESLKDAFDYVLKIDNDILKESKREKIKTEEELEKLSPEEREIEIQRNVKRKQFQEKLKSGKVIFPDYSFGNTFAYYKFYDKYSDIYYQSMFGRVIAAMKVKEEEMNNFYHLVYKYKMLRISKLAKPTFIKDFSIDFRYFAKFYVRLYSMDSPFFKEMNRVLTNDNFKKRYLYNPFLIVLYKGLEHHLIENKRDKLYRGSVLSEGEINKIKEKFEEKKKKDSEKKEENKKEKEDIAISIALLTTQTFLSASLDESVAMKFMTESQGLSTEEQIELSLKKKSEKKSEEKKSEPEKKKEEPINKPKLLPVMIIINECKYSNFIPHNIYIGDLSKYPEEKEVLILPKAYLQILNVEEHCKPKEKYFYKDVPIGEPLKEVSFEYTKITLGYIENIQEIYEKLTEEEQQKIKKNADKSGISKELSDLMQQKVTNNQIKDAISDVYNKVDIGVGDSYFTAFYESDEINEEILNESFNELNSDNCTMYIDGKKQDQLKKKFNIHGFHKVIVVMKDKNGTPHSIKTTEKMFSGCGALISANFSNFDMGQCENMTSMFEDCFNLESVIFAEGKKTVFKTKNCKNMTSLFKNCEALTKIDFSIIDTSNTERITEIFAGCKSLRKIIFPDNFDISKVKSTFQFFFHCENLAEVTFKNINTSSLENIEGMFSCCYKLNKVEFPKSFDTSKVKNMTGAFYSCKELKTLDIKNWKFQSVEYLDGLFCGCSSLSSIKVPDDFKAKNLKNLISKEGIFSECKNLADKLTVDAKDA